MPLVTSSSVQGNLYRQADAPATATDGDVWVDTDTGAIYTGDGTNWIQQTVGSLGSALQVMRTNTGATALEFAANSAMLTRDGYATLGADTARLTATVGTTYDIYEFYAVIKSDTTNPTVNLEINGDTGANYSWRLLSEATVTGGTSATSIACSNSSITIADIPIFIHGVIYNRQQSVNHHSAKVWANANTASAVSSSATMYAAQGIHSEAADISSFSLFLGGAIKIRSGAEIVWGGRNFV